MCVQEDVSPDLPQDTGYCGRRRNEEDPSGLCLTFYRVEDDDRPHNGICNLEVEGASTWADREDGVYVQLRVGNARTAERKGGEVNLKKLDAQDYQKYVASREKEVKKIIGERGRWRSSR